MLRNCSGEFKCVFSCPIPHIEINSAEIWAIHIALSITIRNDSFRHQHVIIESDSQNAVLWCNAETRGPWNLAFALNFICNALKAWMNISITFKGRETNFVADALAKQGIQRTDDFVAWL